MGLVLVFDVDGTIGPVGGEPGQGLSPINPKILEVIREALPSRAKALDRRAKTVDALFILSNNSDTGYMSRIETRIQELLGTSEPIFDDIMVRGDYRRDIYYEDFYLEEGLPVHNPRKSLADVATMIESVNATSDFFKSKSPQRRPISLRNLAKRVYFFDDLENHVIRGEIQNTHYIHINPSYTGSRSYKDKTRYYSLISEIRGNKRTTRKL
jgi:hypothetical protein